MNFFGAFRMLTLLTAPVLATAACPDSPASVHAKCKMKIVFNATPCDMVKSEIISRISGEMQWVDPHNGGTYNLSSNEEAKLKGSRRTGDNKYTDLFEMEFTDEGANCVVEACSASQVTSVLDFSTNYCNLHSLYCNKHADGCPIVDLELEYTEKYEDCWQHKATNCLPERTVEQ